MSLVDVQMKLLRKLAIDRFNTPPSVLKRFMKNLRKLKALVSARQRWLEYRLYRPGPISPDGAPTTQVHTTNHGDGRMQAASPQ
jgi:hypothetical protein